MQSLRRAVGKSIKSSCYCLREHSSINSQQLHGHGRFRSTSSSSSSFLLLNPKIGVSSLHSIYYGRSFSSSPSGDDIIISGGTGSGVVDEAGKVPLVEQLFDTDIIISGGSGAVDEASLVEQLFDYVTFPVVVGMIIAFSLSRRLLISWLVKRPDTYFYEDVKYYCSCFIVFAACICTPAQDSLMNMLIIITLATCTHKAIGMLLDEFDKLEARLSLPFSVGDTIKIGKKKSGYEEFKVLGKGRTFTTLSTADNCELYVPNYNISEQMIVGSIAKKIELKIDDVDKIRRISEDITSMLKLNPNVCLEMEAPPYCSFAQERSHFELTLKYDLILEDKESENDVLINVVPIIKKHGGESISNPIVSRRFVRTYTYF